MTFASLLFVVFFAIVVPAYYLCPHRYRYLLVLLASCYFYMAFVPKYILILFFLIVIDFFFAQKVEKVQGAKRKLFFIASIVSNVGVLFVFKYFNFFNENLALLADAIHWNYSIESLSLLLPIGLSFHIFQSLSYVTEVYRGKHPSEKNIGMYAAYVMFFPQLVAGPIERPQQLLLQLKKRVHFDIKEVSYGLEIMAWGFFKKLVIADRLGVCVDYIYGNTNNPHIGGMSIILATIFFAFQLYADFSGYSDIARGTAKVLGIDIMRNFNAPYFSRSIAEFWRRWHISLSTWFRDYFYYPLVHSRAHTTRRWLYISVIVTFLATGLWHGAGWTFVILGLLHGSAIVLGSLTKTMREKSVHAIGLHKLPKIRNSIQVVMTFSLVSFSWIFFRAPDLKTAYEYISKLFTGWNLSFVEFASAYFIHPYNSLGITQSELLISVGCIVFLLCTEYAQLKYSLSSRIRKQPSFVRSFAYATLVLLIITLGVFGTKQFIYFQF